MVVTRVFSGSWPTQFDELNKMLLEVQIPNSLCAFHMIHIVLKVTNNCPFALQDFITSKLALFIVEVPLDFPIPFVSIPPTTIPSRAP
jgi:hypothetical protein